MGLFDGLDLGTLLNAALGIYGIKQSQKPPKFYVAPQTPTEQWRTDATKGLYNTASGFTNQYLSGLGNMNPDFKLNTSLAGNPAFMGGLKLPSFDPSKIPQLGQTPTPTGTGTGTGPTTPPGPATGVGVGNGPGNTAGTGTDPFANTAGVNVSGLPQDQQTGLGQIWSWMQQHPKITTGGAAAVATILGATGGPLAGILASVGSKVFKNWFKQATQSNYFQNILNTMYPPGDDPNKQYTGNPNPTGARFQTPEEINTTHLHIDPTTGQWSMDNPSAGEQAWLDSVNQFFTGLRGDNGNNPTAGNNMGIGADPKYTTVGGYLGGGPFN